MLTVENNYDMSAVITFAIISCRGKIGAAAADLSFADRQYSFMEFIWYKCKWRGMWDNAAGQAIVTIGRRSIHAVAADPPSTEVEDTMFIIIKWRISRNEAVVGLDMDIAKSKQCSR